MKALPLPILALAALAACDGGTQSAEVAAEEARADGNTVGGGAVSQPNTAEPPNGAEPEASEIPAAIRGRWGLAAADCEPGRSDAKGLLTIDATRLEFYESVGTLDAIEEAGPTRIRAAFDFEGEGMTWEREIVLDVQDEGATLIRREYGEDAAPGPFRYARCNQGR